MKMQSNKKKVLWCIIGGLVVGVINGFLGGGGGMIVVPILTFLIGLEDKKAHATAILVILPITICSTIIYFLNNEIDLMKCLYSGIGFIVGGIVGALLLKKINNKVLRVLFSIIMVIAGIKMLI